MESKKSIQRKAKANLSEKATPEKAQPGNSPRSVRITKSGFRFVNATRKGQEIIMTAVRKP